MSLVPSAAAHCRAGCERRSSARTCAWAEGIREVCSWRHELQEQNSNCSQPASCLDTMPALHRPNLMVQGTFQSSPQLQGLVLPGEEVFWASMEACILHEYHTRDTGARVPAPSLTRIAAPHTPAANTAISNTYIWRP